MFVYVFIILALLDYRVIASSSEIESLTVIAPVAELTQTVSFVAPPSALPTSTEVKQVPKEEKKQEPAPGLAVAAKAGALPAQAAANFKKESAPPAVVVSTADAKKESAAPAVVGFSAQTSDSDKVAVAQSAQSAENVPAQGPENASSQPGSEITGLNTDVQTTEKVSKISQIVGKDENKRSGSISDVALALVVSGTLVVACIAGYVMYQKVRFQSNTKRSTVLSSSTFFFSSDDANRDANRDSMLSSSTVNIFSSAEMKQNQIEIQSPTADSYPPSSPIERHNDQLKLMGSQRESFETLDVDPLAAETLDVEQYEVPLDLQPNGIIKHNTNDMILEEVNSKFDAEVDNLAKKTAEGPIRSSSSFESLF